MLHIHNIYCIVVLVWLSLNISCTAGYLSTDAKGIMCELLRFICSVVENGNSANDAILSLLPNLFGPGWYAALYTYILINEYSSINFCMINDEIAQSNGMYIGEENCNNY